MAAEVEARIAGLEPLDWRGCCKTPAQVPQRFSVEMMHGRLVLAGGASAIDLRSGEPIAAVTTADAGAVAAAFAEGNAIQPGRPQIDRIDYDQWTVSGFKRDRPLYRVRLGDAEGTYL